MSKSLATIIDRTAKERGIGHCTLLKQLNVNTGNYYNWQKGKKASYELAAEVLRKINSLNGHAVENAVMVATEEKEAINDRVLSCNLSDSDKVTILRSLSSK